MFGSMTESEPRTSEGQGEDSGPSQPGEVRLCPAQQGTEAAELEESCLRERGRTPGGRRRTGGGQEEDRGGGRRKSSVKHHRITRD